MERIWIIVSGCLAMAAGALFFYRRFDGAFVCVALSVLAWFLDMRSRLRKDMPMIENVSEDESECPGVQDED
jgi:hypothetical protein